MSPASRGAAEVRVLALRGDPADLAVLASVVAAHDFELQILPSSDLLVEEILRYQPDAVVLDVDQPGADGYELCARLKANPGTHGVPVVLTSALDGPEARRLAFGAGCDELIEKPINRQFLAYRLRSLARLRRSWVRENPSERILSALWRFVQAKERGLGRTDDRLLRACAGFAADLDLSAAERHALEHAAVLHDIGEIAIPEAILVKSGPLSPHETEIMQRHTEIGAALLQPLPDTALLVSIVRHHHERWDGGGYPEGLAGEAIPRLARVFRILDVFDTLTRDQPSLRAHSLAEALEVLRRDGADGGADLTLLARFERWLAAEGHALWS